MRRSIGLAVRCVGSVLIIGPAAFAAQGPREAVTVARPVGAHEVVEILGPGPIPPTGPLQAETHPVPKALTIEDAIDLCVESDMAWFDAPGAAVAVILDSELLYERGYGEKLRGSNDPVDPDTIFPSVRSPNR